MLLESGADPNLQNSQGDNAAHIGARTGNIEVLGLPWLICATKICTPDVFDSEATIHILAYGVGDVSHTEKPEPITPFRVVGFQPLGRCLDKQYFEGNAADMMCILMQ